MKIGLDFDGVISNCGKLKSDGAKKLFGVDISPDKFIKEIVVGEGYLSFEQYRELQQNIYGTREIGLCMEPVKGALDYIARLMVEGHTIRVVTSRNAHYMEIAKEWSWRQGLVLDFVGVGYHQNKALAVKGLDIYVDDDLDKLEPLISVVPHLFLFTWGYNAEIDTNNVAKRVASWQEFYSAIKKITR